MSAPCTVKYTANELPLFYVTSWSYVITEVEMLAVFGYSEFSLILFFSHGFLQKILVDMQESLSSAVGKIV